MATPKVILLKGDPIRKEALAAEAITPGHLLEFVPTGGDAGQLRKHSTAAGVAQAMFAVEESLVGDEIGDAYADGDTVQYMVCRKGDEVYGFLEAGASVNIGAALESNGAGDLQARTGNFPVAQALETKDNSAGIVHARIKVEIL